MNEPAFVEMTEEAYLSWESQQIERSELHHGFAVSFAGGTYKHDQIAQNVRDVLRANFRSPCSVCTSDLKVRIEKTTYFYPDAGVICESVDDEAAYVERPCILVEVLSRRTRSYDLIEKRAAYRTLASLDAYVIVHTTERYVEVDVRRSTDGWTTMRFREGEPVFLGDVTIPMNDIYRSHLQP